MADSVTNFPTNPEVAATDAAVPPSMTDYPEAVARAIAKNGAHQEYLIFQGQLGRPKVNLAPANAPGRHGVRLQFNVWDLINDAVDGTGGFVDGSYLVPHELEILAQLGGFDRKFLERMQLARYDKFAKVICDGPWNSIISMQDVIVREAKAHPRLEEWWDDVDGNGTDIVDFLEYPVSQARRFGTGWVFLDRPSSVRSRKDDLTAQPWAYTVPTRNVIWWEFSRSGALEVVAYHDPQDSSEYQDETSMIPLFIWTRYSWSRWIPTNDKANPYTLDDAGPNELGSIPACMIFDESPGCGKAFGKSNMLSTSILATDVYNRDSEIREIERKCAFPILNINIDDIADAKEVVIGTNGALVTDGKIPPNYLEPALNSIDKLQAERVAVKEAAFVNSEMTGLLGHTQAMRTTSGFHAEVELDKSERRIGKLAASVESAENKMAKLFLALIGEADEGYSISYPRKFGLVDQDTVITRTRDRLSLNLGERDSLEVLKDYYSQMYPRKTADEVTELATLAAQARVAAPPLAPVQIPGQPREPFTVSPAESGQPAAPNPVPNPVQTARERLGIKAKGQAA